MGSLRSSSTNRSESLQHGPGSGDDASDTVRNHSVLQGDYEVGF
jgi:hypothetical protein